MAYPDLSDIISRVRDALNDQSVVFYPDAMITRWINEGERDVAAKSLCLERLHSLISAANVRYATLSAYVVKVHGVEYIPGGTARRVGLGKILPHTAGRVHLDGATPQYWFPWGNKVCIEPIPTVSTYKMVAYVSILPTAEMANSTDEPQIPSAFVPWIQQFAVIRGLWRDHKFASAARMYALYIAQMKQARLQLLRKYATSVEQQGLPDVIEGVRTNG